jgi:hypothetical protein
MGIPRLTDSPVSDKTIVEADDLDIGSDSELSEVEMKEK